MEKFKSGKRTKLTKEIQYISFEELKDDILEDNPPRQPKILLAKQENEQVIVQDSDKVKRKRLNAIKKFEFVKKQLIQLNVNEKWGDVFSFIDILRKINKYHKSILNTLNKQITSFLQIQIKSLRSCLSKNSLLLAKEIFQVQNQDNLIEDTYFKTLIPVILLKTVYDKNFIKKIALETMTILERKLNYQIVVILSQNLFHKNVKIAEIASRTLYNFLSNKNRLQEGMLLGLPVKQLKILIGNLVKGLRQKGQLILKESRKNLIKIQNIFQRQSGYSLQNPSKKKQKGKKPNNFHKEVKKVYSFKKFIKTFMKDVDYYQLAKTLAHQSRLGIKRPSSFKDFLKQKKRQTLVETNNLKENAGYIVFPNKPKQLEKQE